MSRCLKTLTLDLGIGARTPSVALDCWSEVNKHNQSVIYIYSQTCIKRSPLGPRKSGLIRQVTSK